MGKTRKHKLRYSTNPLGVLDQEEQARNEFFAEDFENSHGPIEAIRDQLLDSNLEEKLLGLQHLSNISNNKEKIATICNTDIIRIAAPLLYEKDLSVRNAAAGALRNISICGPAMCDFLVEQDILTPLLTLISDYTEDPKWVPSFDETMCNQMDLRSDIFLQAVNLLWNVCESSSLALDIFNQTQLLGDLVRYLDITVYGLDIAISVAQCLFVVSECNPKSWNILSQNVTLFHNLLTTTGDHSHTLLCTLSAGILSNIPAVAAGHAAALVKSLGVVLNVNHENEINSVINFLSTQEPTDNAPELEIKMDIADCETEEAARLRRRRQELPNDDEIALVKLGNLLDAQRLAAEIITNLCSFDEEECTEVEEDESDCESVNDYENNSSNLNLQNDHKLPLDVVEVINSIGLIEKLWRKVPPLKNNVIQTLREHNITLLIKEKNLRISSLICLQNLCNTLTTNDLGGCNGLYEVWVNLGQQVFKGPQDTFILEPSTSLMRSALEHLKMNKDLFNQMTESDLQLILNGVKECTVAEIRANWLRMLGTLGCVLPEALVKVIISFILETCEKEDNVWTLSEALDALMDMFFDNDWNQIIVDLNLTTLIKYLEKMFKTKIRQQRRELKERYPAVQTVRSNLSRFVKYIENESIKFLNTNQKNHTQ